MSGGHFDYRDHCLEDIAEELEKVIRDNDSNDRDEYGDLLFWGFSPEVIEKLQDTVTAVKIAATLVHRADYLLSGDDGEEAYLEQVEAFQNELFDKSHHAT